jgi:hypothetical protein
MGHNWARCSAAAELSWLLALMLATKAEVALALATIFSVIAPQSDEGGELHRLVRCEPTEFLDDVITTLKDFFPGCTEFQRQIVSLAVPSCPRACGSHGHRCDIWMALVSQSIGSVERSNQTVEPILATLRRLKCEDGGSDTVASALYITSPGPSALLRTRHGLAWWNFPGRHSVPRPRP